jgi:hypothetical protein
MSWISRPCADVFQPARSEVVVDAADAAILADLPLECAGGYEPAVQAFAADAEGRVEVLVRASAVAVERYGEVVHSELGHVWVPSVLAGQISPGVDPGSTITSSRGMWNRQRRPKIFRWD